MEDRKGYKKTKLGWIPEGWNILRLDNLCEIAYGKDSKTVRSETGKYDILGTGGVMGKATKYLYDKPSVLIGRKGTINKPMFIDNPFWTVDTLFYTKINKNINPKWFYYYIKNTPLMKYNEATGVPSLSRENLYGIKIKTPPLPEQQKIASILTTVDEKIESIDKQIEQTEQLKKGLSQELLTKGIGHTEFKDSKIGRIPVEWDVKTLGSIGTFKNGINKGKEDFGHGIPFVNLMDVFGNTAITNKEFGLVLASPQEQNNYNLLQGDVLFIRSSVKPSGVGLTVLVEENLPNTIYSGFLIRYRSKQKYFVNNYKKFCFYENSFRNRLLAKSSVSANTNINQNSLNSLFLALPPLPEQKQIAAILSAVDDKIEILQSKKSNHETLKKGLMEQLLTGQMRVQV